MLRLNQKTENTSGGTPLERLLAARGITSQEEAARYLHPSKEHLHDPMLLSGMKEALALVRRAQSEGWTICVYGDYDVDGVSATAILTGFLRGQGLDAFHYIPSRHSEGYGLNEQAVRKIAGIAKLLITVDCGIRAADLIELASSLGLAAIVTDHHQVDESCLPACPVINPLLNGYSFPSLCGAGVAFKLALALDEGAAWDYVDLAALATVADVVPLTGENRVLVKLGLERINQSPRPGLKALIDCAQLHLGQIRAGHIAFQLGPRLNAGGRIGDAGRSLRLLQSESYEEALPIAQELERENDRRRQMTEQILQEAEAQLEDFDFARRRVIVLRGANWNTGVVGLAASRLVEKYNVPAVLLGEVEGSLTGSCRSIPGVDIYQALVCASGRLIRFGGHKQAAGVTLHPSDFAAFADELNEAVRHQADPAVFVPGAAYDMALSIDKIDESFVRSLDMFQPTGFGNPSPVFLAEVNVRAPQSVGKTGAHLRMTLEEAGVRRPGIGFGLGKLKGEGPRRALYAPGFNAYRGAVALQCEVKALLPADYQSAMALDEAEAQALLQSFLTERFYNKGYPAPKRADAPIWDEAQLDDWLGESPYGTLILAATPDAAQALLRHMDRAFPPDRLDVYAGRYPDDPRPFNALCVLPCGKPPKGFALVVALDAPALLWPEFDCFQPRGAQARSWLAELPDLDQLRVVYQAARSLLKRPFYARRLSALLREVGDYAQAGPVCALAALMVLNEMGLVAFAPQTPSLNMMAFHKADPFASAIFQRVCALRTWGGDLV